MVKLTDSFKKGLKRDPIGYLVGAGIWKMTDTVFPYDVLGTKKKKVNYFYE